MDTKICNITVYMAQKDYDTIKQYADRNSLSLSAAAMEMMHHGIVCARYEHEKGI